MIIQCCGGWCRSRDNCAHYLAPAIEGRNPVERLCGPVEEPEWQEAGKVANLSRPNAIATLEPLATLQASNDGCSTLVATLRM